ncbi:LacI family DNA-binding transcriptional regulator [Tamlana sp. s12]|uniref:LacI family DNA-binding transcriptional regulator n=1 Tax=Tamlana sp. s12 TaxID=1630406 RepID=UPI0008016EC7|nr:LacI family DNA-binding transcriptional regulator [Tamlana sp. s12]OBQ52830.1 transcriptional regulator [Tamlana sp. s12]QQY81147.1 LacI family DNA-binding transcriptional regulator [Tamlana sp. s12]
MKHITIKDIAKKLNVSISTVSRAFNDKYDIRQDTKELILKTAKELGYRPNPMAKKLIQQRSFNIGIVVPEFEKSYFPQVILGAQNVLLEHNYQVLLMQSNESSETERKNVETLVDNMVDGLIISLCSEEENIAYYKQLIAKGLPIVFFNRVIDELEATKVLFDDYKWAFFTTEHLIQQGLKNIIHIAPKKKYSYTNNRISGYKDAMTKHKLVPQKIIYSHLTVEDGEEIATRFIETKNIPDAIFSSNDYCAIGAMRVFKQHGFKIPKDIAFAGFSETQLSEFVDPQLTSVSQPTKLIGKTAAELLLKQIDNKESSIYQTVVLNGNLNIRESSMKVLKL